MLTNYHLSRSIHGRDHGENLLHVISLASAVWMGQSVELVVGINISTDDVFHDLLQRRTKELLADTNQSQTQTSDYTNEKSQRPLRDQLRGQICGQQRRVFGRFVFVAVASSTVVRRIFIAKLGVGVKSGHTGQALQPSWP